MNSEFEGGKTGKVVEKMERALKYFERRENDSARKISPMPKRSSRRVVAKIIQKKLIG